MTTFIMTFIVSFVLFAPVGVSATRGAGPPLFDAAALPFGPGGRLYAVDVDGDAAAELVFASGEHIEVRGGANSFQDPLQVVNVGYYIDDVHVVDLDADGDQDIIVTEYTDPRITILRNVEGLLQLDDTVDVGDNIGSSGVGDLNADGFPDFCVTTYYPDDRLIILANDGHGHFVQWQDFPHYVTNLAMGDVDSDGDLDVATKGFGHATMLLWLNDGTGQLVEHSPLTLQDDLSPPFYFIDVDGDGDADIIDGELRLHRNDLNLEFVLIQGPTEGFVLSELLDVNGDDIIDAIGRGGDLLIGDGVAIAHGVGGGHFTAPVEYPTVYDVGGGILLDVDFDGVNELLIGGGGMITVLRESGDDAYATNLILGLEIEPPRAAQVADINGDDLPDLVVAHDWKFPGNVTVLMNDGAVGFESFATLNAGAAPYDLRVRDINADGLVDIVTANHGTDDVGVLLGQGGGLFAPKMSWAIGSQLTAVEVADFTGDGLADIAVTSDDSNALWILTNFEGRDFEVSQLISTQVMETSRLQAADMDADGDIDLAHSVPNLGVIAILNDGHGSFTVGETVAPMGKDGRAMLMIDLDADDDSDVIIGFGDDQVHTYLNDGTGVFHHQSTNFVDATVGPISAGDINDDGRVDFVVPSTALNFCCVNRTVGVLIANREGGYDHHISLIGGSHLLFAPVADLDLDGDDDVVSLEGHTSFNDNLISLVVYRSNGACVADINGDGELSILDFVAFQLAWEAQEPKADCSEDGAFDVLDFVCFQQAFVAGCVG
jgi:hypothetical protein